MGSTKDSHSILIYECCLYRSLHSLLTTPKIGKIFRLQICYKKVYFQQDFWKYFGVATLILFAGSYGCGVGAISWFISSELTPIKYRTLMQSACYGINTVGSENRWTARNVASAGFRSNLYFCRSSILFLDWYLLFPHSVLSTISICTDLHNKVRFSSFEVILSTVVSSGIFPRLEEGKFTI